MCRDSGGFPLPPQCYRIAHRDNVLLSRGGTAALQEDRAR